MFKLTVSMVKYLHAMVLDRTMEFKPEVIQILPTNVVAGQTSAETVCEQKILAALKRTYYVHEDRYSNLSNFPSAFGMIVRRTSNTTDLFTVISWLIADCGVGLDASLNSIDATSINVVCENLDIITGLTNSAIQLKRPK